MILFLNKLNNFGIIDFKKIYGKTIDFKKIYGKTIDFKKSLILTFFKSL